jgi:hypothetical protein
MHPPDNQKGANMAKTRKQRVAYLQLVWQVFVVLALVACFYLWRHGVSALLLVIVFGLFVFAFIHGLL